MFFGYSMPPAQYIWVSSARACFLYIDGAAKDDAAVLRGERR